VAQTSPTNALLDGSTAYNEVPVCIVDSYFIETWVILRYAAKQEFQAAEPSGRHTGTPLPMQIANRDSPLTLGMNPTGFAATTANVIVSRRFPTYRNHCARCLALSHQFLGSLHRCGGHLGLSHLTFAFRRAEEGAQRRSASVAHQRAVR
jgi:hypothetical protein